MRIFKTTWFSRLAAKEGISDEELKALVDSLEHGEAEADLGGGVYKQRIARAGGGKSGGYRVIVYFKSEYRSFFVYGYAKSDRENINKNELKYFKNAAKTNFRSKDEQIAIRLQRNTLKEIISEAVE